MPKPFDPTVSYCNGEQSAGQPHNSCCFDHDRGYSEPAGRTRAAIDRAFLKCMTARGLRAKGWIMYLALRAGGWIRWNACRRHDRTEQGRNAG